MTYEAHYRSPSDGPLSSIGKSCPNLVTVVGLWAVDRPNREPDEEYKNNDHIKDSAYFINPANEIRRCRPSDYILIEHHGVTYIA
jgi:hypothetical protein